MRLFSSGVNVVQISCHLMVIMLTLRRLVRPLCTASSKVHASVVVLDGCHIGKNCVIGPNSVIGPDVEIGQETTIGAGVVIQHASIGERVVIHPGACIGQDGFGFHIGSEQHEKKPQTLRVSIGNDVEIGANTTIDRGSWRDTCIGEGTKIDNLVQIGHNVKIGKNCLIAAQTGIAGSTEIGDFVFIGGQTGIKQHLKIASNVQIAAKSGVMTNLGPGKYGGVPAIPIIQYHKQTLALRKLK